MNKWDLYDDKFNKTDIVIKENEEIPDGLFHYTINVWIINSKKQVMLVRNPLNLNIHYPGFWNSINGNVLSNDDSINTCIKLLKEKIGIDVKKKEIKSIDVKLRENYKYIYETIIVNKDIDLKQLKFTDKSFIQAKWIDLKELKNMIENGEIAMVMIPRIEEYIMPLLKQ